MSRFKNMSRGGYIVLGIVMALILVPSGVAAALAYNGIEGSSGHEANVSDDGQLLTVPALPSAYKDYFQLVDSASGKSSCTTVTAIPEGKAFVVQQIEVDVHEADPPVDNYSSSEFGFFADTAAQGCPNGTLITSGDAPDFSAGNVAIPLVPGYVIPTGYHLDVLGIGIDADVYATGYLVPSADAGPTPEVGSGGAALIHPGRP